MTRQIAGAASGTHKHYIENTTLSVAKEYVYLQANTRTLWCGMVSH